MADIVDRPTGSDEEEEVPELDQEEEEEAQASFFDAQDTTGQQPGRQSPATSRSGSLISSDNNSIGTMSAGASVAPTRSVTVLSLSDRFEDEDPRDPSTLTGGMVTLKRDERGTMPRRLTRIREEQRRPLTVRSSYPISYAPALSVKTIPTSPPIRKV
jgi:hypothetical protein